MIDSISSYLLSQKINTETTAVKKAESTASAETADFAKKLTEQINNITSIQELSGALSGSVLSSLVSQTSDLEALSQDLLSTGSGRKVIEQLAQGHLDSIVLSGNDNKESAGIVNTLSDYTESVENTSSIESIIGQLSNLTGLTNKDEE